MEGFGGQGRVMEAAGDYVGEGAEGGFYLGDLGGVGADEGGVGGEPLGRELEVRSWNVGLEARGEGGCVGGGFVVRWIDSHRGRMY